MRNLQFLKNSFDQIAVFSWILCMNGVNSDPVQNTFSGGFPMEKNSMFDRNKQYALCPFTK